MYLPARDEYEESACLIRRIVKELKGVFIMIVVGHSLGGNNHFHITGVGNEILAKIDSLERQNSTGMFLLGDSKHVGRLGETIFGHVKDSAPWWSSCR
jgi:hypothetical protein